MKKYLLVSLLALLVFVGKAQEDNSDIVKIGDTMPSFMVVSDNGSELQSVPLKGKMVLMNFSATRCPPRQKELAAVQQTLWPRYKNSKDFILLVTGHEHSDADLQKYNERKGLGFPLHPDKDRTIFGAFTKNPIPRGYLIRKNRRIIYTGRGYTDEEFAELMTKIEGTLK